MSGDLGNLLTGELGEAEARFSHEDFAALYGRRIAGRVRRRRAVRAAGVGGGTMLTAGALVVGATQVPWGTLSAVSGVGGSDCATTSASDDWQSHSMSIDTGGGLVSERVFTDNASGATILRGVRQTDGTYLFTDGQGNPLSATQGVGGYYTVELPPGAFYDDVTGSISVEPGGQGSVSSVVTTLTQSQSDDSFVYEVTVVPGDVPDATVRLTDPANGTTILAATLQPDGSYYFADRYGIQAAATLEASGRYQVTVAQGPAVSAGGPADPGAGEILVNSIRTAGLTAPGAAAPSASDDCYTSEPTPTGEATASPDPSPSPDPSLAAKTDDAVDSPFQCGFVMDSLAHDSSQVSIVGYDWVSPADFNATLQERWPTSTTLPLERGTSPMPVAKVRVTQDQSVLNGTFGPGEPTDERAGTADGSPMVNTGASFVGVRDGVVVATADTATQAIQGENSHFYVDYDGTTHSLTLVNASDAFIACPGQTFDPTTGTIFAVAGSYVKDASRLHSTDVEYSWAQLERN